MVSSSSSLGLAQTTALVKVTLPIPPPNSTWQNPFVFLSSHSWGDRLISPVWSFEPGYPESPANHGAAVVRMGQGHVEPNENTQEAGSLGTVVHGTGSMATTLCSVVILCVSMAFLISPGENSLQRSLVAVICRSHKYSYFSGDTNS